MGPDYGVPAVKRSLVLAVLVAMAATAFAQHDHRDHHGHHGDAGNGGDWSEHRLVLPAGSAWGTEQCFYLEGDHTVTYRFEADAEVNVNFHVHPERGGEYHTVYLRQEDGLSEGDGSVETSEPGAYCFEFNRPGADEADIRILLHYTMAPR